MQLLYQLSQRNTSKIASTGRSKLTSENIASMLPESERSRSSEQDSAVANAPALDLSLLGIISLGVLGLFWIRRHTSEL